jgi:hypothetical protein
MEYFQFRLEKAHHVPGLFKKKWIILEYKLSSYATYYFIKY